MTDAPVPHPPLDLVGDVHGHIHALRALGRALGYDVDGAWDHPEGRVLVFLGDLVDGGPRVLETCELIIELCRAGRAFVIMGNHEYALLAWWWGLLPGEQWNVSTLEDVRDRTLRWKAVIEYLSHCPVAVETPELRLVHACWHAEALERVGHRRRRVVPKHEKASTVSWLRQCIQVTTPFPSRRAASRRHKRTLPGSERPADKYLLSGPKEGRDRVAWWDGLPPRAPGEPLTVVGHYRGLPAPPDEPPNLFPPSVVRPERKAWVDSIADRARANGRVPLPATAPAVCVDYSALRGASYRLGALRWPEAEIVWASAPPKAPEPQAG